MRRQAAPAAPTSAALEAISDAVERGAGLPEVVRAAARALDASLVLIDRSSRVLAVAARSPADERSLMAGERRRRRRIELRVADEVVGQLRVRAARDEPPPALLRLVATLIALEVERVRAPERASEAARRRLRARAALRARSPTASDIVARASELGVDLAQGGAIVVVRAHPAARPRTTGARACSPSAERARPRERAGRARRAASARRRRPARREVVVLVPGPTTTARRRVAAAVRRELRGRRCTGFTFTVGRSRAARATRSTCTAPATRRCWPRTWPRPRGLRRSSPSRRPAPTGCCCRR